MKCRGVHVYPTANSRSTSYLPNFEVWVNVPLLCPPEILQGTDLGTMPRHPKWKNKIGFCITPIP